MAQRALLAESVYRRMRSDLMRGRILPGSRVTEQWAAAHYRASRTPVREACRRLAEDGLLSHKPRQGYWAPMIDLREVDELYAVRRALEAVSVRGASQAATAPSVVAQLRRAWSGDAPAAGEEAVYRDEAFHVGLARLGGNRVLGAMLGSINARIRLVRVHDFLEVARVEITVHQHLGILDAVEAGRADQAAELMDAHISESQAMASQAATRALAELWGGAAMTR